MPLANDADTINNDNTSYDNTDRNNVDVSLHLLANTEKEAGIHFQG